MGLTKVPRFFTLPDHVVEKEVKIVISYNANEPITSGVFQVVFLLFFQHILHLIAPLKKMLTFPQVLLASTHQASWYLGIAVEKVQLFILIKRILVHQRP